MNPAELVGLTGWTVAWTLAGGMGGYLLGRLTRDMARIADAQQGQANVNDEHDVDDERIDEPQPGFRGRWPGSGRLVIGILIVVLGVGTAIQGIVTNNRVQHLQQCQAHYSNQFADALDARTDLSQGSQHYLDKLVTTIGTHVGHNKPADQNAIADAVEKYLAQRHQAKQLRAQHPLPDPPRDACG